jgi:putative nucleotidyltransferase with HDIG domain
MVVDQERFSTLICKMLPGRYESLVAGDGLQAVQALKEHPPDVMVVEMAIPGNGLRLAELVGMSPKYNHIPVVLTSASPSLDIVLKAKEAGVSSYLAKPFRPSELLSRIEQALAEPVGTAEGAEGASSEGGASGSSEPGVAVEGAKRTIRDRVRKIDGLPVFPATHAEIMKLAKSENATSEALAEQIKMDPSLLATILKLVNSAYYGLRKKVDSLKVAVSLLGFEEIANLVMSAQVFQNLGGYKNKLGLDLKAFWRHSVGTGFVARSVAKKLQTESETAFLAGMLHDLGKVVLDRFFPDYYIQVMNLVKGGEMSIGQAEEEILGLTHAEVGGQLASEWKFSENLQNVIMYHHAPESARRYQRLVGLVHLADAICRTLQFGSGGDMLAPQIDSAVMDRFALTEKGLQMFTETAREDLESAESFLMALG